MNANQNYLIFVNSFRWLNLLLALVLLVLGLTPPFSWIGNVIIYSLVFVYNTGFTVFGTRIENWIKRFPPLILIDIGFCTFLIAVYGWKTPFSFYAFSPILLGGYLWNIGGGLMVATLSSAGYLLATSTSGYTWKELDELGLLDFHISHVVIHFIVAVFFAYPSYLLRRLNNSNKDLEETKSSLERSRRKIAAVQKATASILSLPDMGKILNIVASSAVTQLRFDRVSIGLLSNSSERIDWCVSYPDNFFRGDLEKAGRSPLIKQLLKDKQVKSSYEMSVSDPLKRIIMGGVVALPILGDDETCFGVIMAENENGFESDDLEILKMMTHTVASGINNVKRLNQSLELGVARERNRIAGEMHDNIVQKLFGMRLILETCIKDADDLLLAERLKLLQETFADSLKELRSTLDDLYEEDIGKKKLSSLINDLRNRLGVADMTIRVEIKGSEPRIEKALKKDIYLAASEALTNAVKHSGAKRVVIALNFDKEGIAIEIADDGDGFEPEASGNITGGLGLKNIRQRAGKNGGKAKIESDRARGTRVSLTVPYTVRQETIIH